MNKKTFLVIALAILLFATSGQAKILVIRSADENFTNISLTNAFGGNYYGTWLGSPISPTLYTDTNFETANYVSVTGDSNFLNIGINGYTFLTNFAFYEEGHAEFEYGHTLIDKEYVDKAVTAINTSYYLYDTASGLGDYKLTNIVPSPDAETSVTDAGLTDGTYIQGWISPPDANIPTLVAGIYELHITSEKTAGTETLQLYWLLVERRANETEAIIAVSEYGKIVTSKEAEEIHLSLTYDHDINIDSRIVGKVYARVTGSGNAPTSVLYYRGATVSAWNIPTSSEVLAESFYTKTDVNSMFVPYIGAITDVNLGSFGLKALGDSNFANIGITGNAYMGDWRIYTDVDGNLTFEK